MNDLYLIIKNLTRNKRRLILNSIAILVAFFLFGSLGALQGALNDSVSLTAEERLIVVNKVNFTQPLPKSYYNKINAIDGVDQATYASWFGAYYQEPQQFVTGIAVDAQSWLAVYPEYKLDDQARQRWFQNGRGMIVGKMLANHFGWKVGDLVPISSSIFTQTSGGHVWQMEISGIFSGADDRTYLNQLFFHHKYLSETVDMQMRDYLGWLVVDINDGVGAQTLADKIDAEFANSSFETESASEKQFNKAFLKQLGDIGLMITSLVSAAFFTILLIVGNTMALAIRERTGEIAVLKTLGFSSGRIFRMVLFESMSLALLGGMAGLILSNFAVNGISKVPDIQNMFGNLILTDAVITQSIVYMVALGIVTGFFPAFRALKLNTVEALKRA